MNTRWTVRIERLETRLPVGIYAEERDQQPVWISLTASGLAPAAPDTLDACLDYEPLWRWLTQEWPHTPHTPLLETRVNQVIGHVFGLDPRIDQVWVGLYKQRVSLGALAVGMERASTRAEYEAQCAHTAGTGAFLQTLTQDGETYASLAQ
jgi:7,8-dihydroneopterin aldolase/epimerase/oxygenase